MNGQSRLFRSKFVSAFALGVLSASVMLPAAAGERKAAPIKYVGQGGYANSSTTKTAPVASNSGAPIRYGYENSGSSTYAQPAYSQPVRSQVQQTEAVSSRSKRIEFRYPDQPGVVHSSDGEQYGVAQAGRQYASVGTPVPIASAPENPPILHQPDFARPVIEEVTLPETVLPQAIPAQTQQVSGAVYQPVAQPGFNVRGTASWYGDEYHGQPTANGEVFDMSALSAAHPTLPLPSLVQVTNLENGRELVVRVNDRGPFEPDSMIELSKRAADELGFLVAGAAEVQVRYLGPAPVASQAVAGQGSATAFVSDNSAIGEADVVLAADQPMHRPVMEPIPNPVEPTYYIQAGSFSDMANAERLSAQLGGSLPVDVVLATVNGSDYFRVLIGPYPSRSNAAAMRDQLDVNGIVDGVLIAGQQKQF